MRQNLFQIEHTMLPKGPAGRPVAMANNCNYLGKGAKAPNGGRAFYKHLFWQGAQAPVAQLGGGRYAGRQERSSP